MKFCGLCKEPEDKVGPFITIVKDCVLITENPCCEGCKKLYENKPNIVYSFYKKENKDDLGSIRIDDLYEDGDFLPAPI